LIFEEKPTCYHISSKIEEEEGILKCSSCKEQIPFLWNSVLEPLGNNLNSRLLTYMIVKYVSDIKWKSNDNIIYWTYRCEDTLELWELGLYYISLSM